jgi:uncharacterized DUF497 family protein
MVEFDPAKEEINLSKHGISLARWVDLDIKVAFVDDRYDYGGSAISLTVLLTAPLIAWPLRTAGGQVRPISLRRAHAKEMRRYVT